MPTIAGRRHTWLTPIATLMVFVFSVSYAFDFGADRREDGIYTVEKSVENFRDGPDGRRLGTLLEGTRIERISEDGNWVRFRVEGWVWGPSLEGFEEEREAERESASAPKTEAERVPLQDNLPRLKRLINDTYGVFYGVNLDEIASRLVVRFRVRNLDREDLQSRQMAVQQEVLKILEGELEFATIRIETNRPDGSGQVGTEIAETSVEDVRVLKRGRLAPWRERTRFSSDGGDTWHAGSLEVNAESASETEAEAGQ